MISRNSHDYGKVAVLMGGVSAEREISLQSGHAVLQALLRQHIDAEAVDASGDVISKLREAEFTRVFNMLHGRRGEDGVMQGALEVMGLPYTGSGVLASALAMDKLLTKDVWLANGLSTPPFKLLESEQDLAFAGEQLGYPLIVKPAAEGSSLGMSKVLEDGELKAAWLLAREYDERVMVERWVDGQEYTAAILEGECLPLIRLETPNEFYDYHAKYIADTTRYHCPCGLPLEQEQAMQKLALNAFDIIGASGWGRVDLMMDEHDQPWLIEMNTLPGMTDHSLMPMAARQAGMEFDELVMRILASSIPGVQDA